MVVLRIMTEGMKRGLGCSVLRVIEGAKSEIRCNRNTVTDVIFTLFSFSGSSDCSTRNTPTLKENGGQTAVHATQTLKENGG